MEMERCGICNGIKELISRAEAYRSQMVSMVRAEEEEVIARNAARSADFEFVSGIPVLGRFLVGGRTSPQGIEPLPEPWRSEWFAQMSERLKEFGRVIEESKDGHLEHWGDELVYAGYTPGYRFHLRGPIPRSTIARYKEDGAWALLPDEYVLRPGEKRREFACELTTPRSTDTEGVLARIMRVRRTYASA